MNKSSSGVAVRVWDLPTRLFHWVLVGLIVFSFVTGKMGRIEWHMYSGKVILALVLFRVLWGFAGNEHARFAGFLRGPVETIGYALGTLRGTARRYLGHNPLGGWSALAMILLIGFQATTGMFATDDIYTDGPLKYLVSDDTSKRLTTLHRYGVNVLLVLVGLHVAAVLFYLFVKKDNLARAMVTGRKQAAAGTAGATAGSAAMAVALLAVSLAVVLGGLAIYGK
ncbi:MAG: cytochrome b/b6 domain-containing protein [Alphaproteobacteria bacterium]|nr:cytochrome b/b6 domain-containing protein [Alphaproteobacteria bacterium]